MKSTTIEKLMRAARHAKKNAHAPYSNFPIGASVLSESGEIFAGCNVENAAYPEGLCGEASAIAAMVTSGDRKIIQICIAGEGDLLVPPCGGCRQKIREFSTPETIITICNDQGNTRDYKIEDLLPASFGQEFLETK